MAILNNSENTIIKIIKNLKKNKLVILPTETVYGLAGNALSKEAINSIYKLKKRPLYKKLIIHFADLDVVEKYFYLDNKEKVLAESFWPGPLTLLLKPKNHIYKHESDDNTLK